MKKNLRVLIVEDSEDDTLLMVRYLREGGYEAEYERVDTQKAYRLALAKQSWDIILADYTMPTFTGMKALYILREKDDETPFVFVSGTLGENTAEQAMKAGANDYVAKSDLKRLVPAIEAVLPPGSPTPDTEASPPTKL
jgi:two-component system cell cycle sensor histidine kinase/response regulator CckA